MYKFYTTPAHGYLCVPMADYKASGYKASRYSFELPTSRRGLGMVFLEEDCDARGFMLAADVSLDVVKEVIVNQDLHKYEHWKTLTPMSGEGFDISRSYPSQAST